MSTFDIRPVISDEQRAATNTVRAALLTGAANDEVLAEERETAGEGDFLAAWEGDRCVGHVGAFHFDTTVPGGDRLSTAGVTDVGVLPTHTRRGLLTALIEQLLGNARDAGTVLASLRASESPIYGRFGFGLAGDTVAAVINPRRARPLRFERQPGTMRLLEIGEVLTTVPPIYEESRWRVGTVNRNEWLWKFRLRTASEPNKERHGKGVYVAVHTNTEGEDDGYVHYETEWDEGYACNIGGKGRVLDLAGTTPDVELALWEYIIGIDLVESWQAEPRPVDDPIRLAMYDVRAYETRQRLDEQWVRLLDVDAALSKRSYGPTDREVIIEVTDPMFAENNGNWTISESGAQRTDRAADLGVDIATVSATYMGGVGWTDLAASGLLPNASARAVADLDLLFAIRPAPFSGTMF